MIDGLEGANLVENGVQIVSKVGEDFCNADLFDGVVTFVYRIDGFPYSAEASTAKGRGDYGEVDVAWGWQVGFSGAGGHGGGTGLCMYVLLGSCIG